MRESVGLAEWVWSIQTQYRKKFWRLASWCVQDWFFIRLLVFYVAVLATVCAVRELDWLRQELKWSVLCCIKALCAFEASLLLCWSRSCCYQLWECYEMATSGPPPVVMYPGSLIHTVSDVIDPSQLPPPLGVEYYYRQYKEKDYISGNFSSHYMHDVDRLPPRITCSNVM